MLYSARITRKLLAPPPFNFIWTFFCDLLVAKNVGNEGRGHVLPTTVDRTAPIPEGWLCIPISQPPPPPVNGVRKVLLCCTSQRDFQPLLHRLCFPD